MFNFLGFGLGFFLRVFCGKNWAECRNKAAGECWSSGGKTRSLGGVLRVSFQNFWDGNVDFIVTVASLLDLHLKSSRAKWDCLEKKRGSWTKNWKYVCYLISAIGYEVIDKPDKILRSCHNAVVIWASLICLLQNVKMFPDYLLGELNTNN